MEDKLINFLILMTSFLFGVLAIFLLVSIYYFAQGIKVNTMLKQKIVENGIEIKTTQIEELIEND